MHCTSDAQAGSSLDSPLWIVVPAAGCGSRFGGDIPKQYQQLEGICMLERTVRRLLAVPDVKGIVVVVSEDDRRWQALGLESDARIHRVMGGETRALSVLSGLKFVLQHASPTSWVMVHDAARPLVALSDIQRLVSAVYNSGAIGGLLATPVHDTLKRCDDYACVEQTIERQALWQAQTPQMFRVGDIHEALSAALEAGVTDESSAMELAGHQPLLVEALQPNFKITRPVDWQLALALLRTADPGPQNA